MLPCCRGLSILIAFGYCQHCVSLIGYLFGMSFHIYRAATDEPLDLVQELQVAFCIWVMYYAWIRVLRVHCLALLPAPRPASSDDSDRHLLVKHRQQVDSLVDAVFDAVFRLGADLQIQNEDSKLRNMLVLEPCGSDGEAEKPLAFMNYVAAADRIRLASFLQRESSCDNEGDGMGVATIIEIFLCATDGAIIRAQLFHVAGGSIASDLLAIQELDRTQPAQESRLQLASVLTNPQLLAFQQGATSSRPRGPGSSASGSSTSSAGGLGEVVTLDSVEIELDEELTAIHSVKMVFCGSDGSLSPKSGKTCRLKRCMDNNNFGKFQAWFMDAFNHLLHADDMQLPDLTSLVMDLPKVDVVVHAEKVELEMIEDSEEPKIILRQVSVFPKNRRGKSRKGSTKIRPEHFGSSLRFPVMRPVLSPVAERSSASAAEESRLSGNLSTSKQSSGGDKAGPALVGKPEGLPLLESGHTSQISRL
eukprot:TRINITY_DN65772_c0_g1_i2.p1 TRINITY_DN65772_c0_g1~~TRINITY_DN65772_c0_g1_i2.p1  ORF type:complete len:476 (+),score=81.04 TRINITY_DN65772_c0_g1_i2:269-1696(+)